jgi:hypothetical protein
MLYITSTQLSIVGITEGALVALDTKETDAMLIKWLTACHSGDNKCATSTVMENCLAIRKVLSGIGVASCIADRKCLVKEKTNLSLFRTKVDDMDITHKSTNAAIDNIIKLNENAHISILRDDMANQRMDWIAKRHLPSGIIKPAYPSINPNTDPMACGFTRGVVFKSNVGVIEVVDESIFIDTDVKFTIT